MLIVRDIRVRYKQAAMGFLWALFMPIVAVAAGILIKQAMSMASHQPVDLNGVASISVKVLPWTFFISSIRFCVQSLVGNSNLVTKIYFPKAVLPLASVCACFFDFLISIGVLSVIFIVVKVGISVHLVFVPIIIFFLFCFTAGLGLLLAAANLFYRDVRYVVEILLMFGIFFTPVFYSASALGKWKVFLLINPLGSLLEAIDQAVVLKAMPDPFWLVYAGLISTLIVFLGLWSFEKLQPLFAENI